MLEKQRAVTTEAVNLRKRKDVFRLTAWETLKKKSFLCLYRLIISPKKIITTEPIISGLKNADSAFG